MGVYNISKIESWQDDFIKCKNKFNSNYKSDFDGSYISTCGDLSKIKSKFKAKYNKIEELYKKIENTWKDYLNDIKNADNALASNSSSGGIKASSAAAKLASLPKLRVYEVTLSDKASLYASYAVNWTKENITLESIGATLSTIGVSIIEGLTKLVEDVVDLVAIGDAVIATNFTSNIDIVTGIVASITGHEEIATHFTREVWDATRAFVSENYTKSIFDSFYNETEPGQWIKENALGFDTVRSVTNEVAEVAGVIALSVLTGGGAAAMYGAAKAAEHVEKNWQDENTSTAGGLLKGAIQGAADGAFFAIGMKGDQAARAAAGRLTREVLESGAKTTAKDMLKKLGIYGAKMSFEAATAVAQDGTNIAIDILLSNNEVVNDQGEIIRFNSIEEKAKYFYEQAGGAQGFAESALTAFVLSGLSDFSDVFGNSGARQSLYDEGIKQLKNSGDNVDLNADNILSALGIDQNSAHYDSLHKYFSDQINKDMKKVLENVKNAEGISNNTSPSTMPKAATDITALRKEYDELSKLTEQDWYKKAVGLLDGTADLNKLPQAIEIKERMLKLEGILNISKNSNYVMDINKYKKSGISFEQYAKSNNIKINDYTSELQLAADIGDANWYLVNIIKNNANVNDPQIARIINKPRSELNTAELLNIAGQYLKPSDFDILNNMNVHMKNLSIQEINTLHQFQRAGGCEINGILRGKDYTRLGIKDIYDIEMAMNDFGSKSLYKGMNVGHPRTVSRDSTIIDQLDEIIKNNANTETIKGVGYYKSVGSEVPTDNVMNLAKTKGIDDPETLQALNDLIGLDMTDKAYNSRTIPSNKRTNYYKRYANPNPNQSELFIKVESYISPGCGCYIDTYGGIKDGLGEMLIKRGCKQTIVDAYIDPIVNKLVLVTLFS